MSLHTAIESVTGLSKTWDLSFECLLEKVFNGGIEAFAQWAPILGSESFEQMQDFRLRAEATGESGRPEQRCAVFHHRLEHFEALPSSIPPPLRISDILSICSFSVRATPIEHFRRGHLKQRRLP